MGKAKKKNSLHQFRDIPVYVATNIYLAYLSTFYLLFFHDLYFDITKTRAFCFIYGTIGFIGLIFIAYILRLCMSDSLSEERDTEYLFFLDPKKMTRSPFFWAAIYLLANFISFLGAKDKMAAWTGEQGRRLGLMMVLIFVIMFFAVGYKAHVSVVIYIVLTVVSCIMFYIGIVQHFGTDFGGWRKDIVDNQKTIFMSTIGNMNTFGGYICIFLSISVAILIFANNPILKCFSGIGLFAAAFTVMTSKSDNVYIGTCAAFIILFYLAVHYKKIVEWAAALLVLASGFFAMSIFNEVKKGSKGHLNGIAEIIGNKKIMGIFFFAALIIFAALMYVRVKKNPVYEKFQSKKLMLIVTAAGFVGMIIVLIIGLNSGHEYFTFNDRWGEFRGFIWDRTVKSYNKGNIWNKFFGFGNESVRDVVSKWYLEDMRTIPKKIYDSSHNVILQQLLTTGIVGVAAYVGFVVSSIVYMIKNAAKNPAVMACIAGGTAYFAQAMVNPEQPIITPIFYVLLALGIGVARDKKADKIYHKATSKKR